MIHRMWPGLVERLPFLHPRVLDQNNARLPAHLRHWWFALGSTPAFLFALQCVTGITLACYYMPARSSAWESVANISNYLPWGWYIRGLHRWGATFMLAAVVLHQMRVFFTGAYRRPRELNWMIGMLLLLCAATLGFTGYSLVYEQRGYWAVVVGANLLGSVPLVGIQLKRLLLAGDVFNGNTLPRIYVLHGSILPATVVTLLVVHLLVVRLHGVSELSCPQEGAAANRHDLRFFPDHFFTEMIIGLFLLIVLSVLATVCPPTMGPRADSLLTPDGIAPEWMFLPVYFWLKLFARPMAMLSMAFVAFSLFVWPFVDSLIRKYTRIKEVSVWVGITGVLTILAMTTWEAYVAH